MNDIDNLIDTLASSAVPVKPQRDAAGRAVLGLVAFGIFAAIVAFFGMRPDLADLSAGSQRYLSMSLMAILALASGTHAIRLARPQVGAPAPGISWLVAALAVLPLIAAVAVFAQPSRMAELSAPAGLACLRFGMVAGLAALAYLALWLRRGAPVMPNQAAWLAGLCAGAIGAIGVSLECASPSMLHLDIWHVAVIPVLAVISRLALPRLLRW